MFPKKEIQRLAKQIVVSMRIGRKYNKKGIEKAKRKYKWIERFVKKYSGKTINPKNIKDFNLTDEAIKELSHPKYGPILGKRKGKKFLVRNTIGESIRILYHPDNWELTKAVIIEIIKAGAHPSWMPMTNLLDKELLKYATRESLEELPEISVAMANALDVRIAVENDEDPEWKKSIPTWKFQASRDVWQYIHQLLDKKKQRWLVLGWPFPSVAKYYGKTPEWYSRMIFNALKESFSKKTAKIAEYYAKVLKSADKVRIVDDRGTDLILSVKGRRILKDIGYITDEMIKLGDLGLNIPSGEVFCAPIETSTEGKIFFDKIFIPGYGFVESLWLTFEKGKVVDFKAKKGQERFAKFLEENTESTKVTAEFGIGCNRKAVFSGYILTDEKIFGTIHIAIGNNTGAYHGKNKASAHLDMIKDMRKANAKMYIDGKLVMDKGLPVW
ncbi:MAG: aminopeptidase [Candidatus Micrarchaeia archaeon]